MLPVAPESPVAVGQRYRRKKGGPLIGLQELHRADRKLLLSRMDLLVEKPEKGSWRQFEKKIPISFRTLGLQGKKKGQGLGPVALAKFFPDEISLSIEIPLPDQVEKGFLLLLVPNRLGKNQSLFFLS